MVMHWVLAMALGASVGGVTEVTVGPGADCDFASIGAASAGASGSDLLRILVARGTSSLGNELIQARNTEILGGFETCSSPRDSGATVMVGTGSSRFLRTAAATSERSLLIEQLRFSFTSSPTTGGALQVDGNWDVVLRVVRFADLSASTNGAAIAVSGLVGGNTRLTLDRVGIELVSASADGGGIYCENATVDVFESNIRDSGATRGGGAFVGDGCVLNVWETPPSVDGFLFNLADSGGAIYVDTGGVLNVRGGSNGPAEFTNNSAINGGAIYAATGASLNIGDSLFRGNMADNTGGAIRSNGADVLIQRGWSGSQCFDQTSCITFQENSVASTESFAGGGAIYAFGGTLIARGAYFVENSAANGSAIRTRFMTLVGGEPTATIVGSVFADNTTASQVVYVDDSDADIGFSTFIDNQDISHQVEVAYPTTAGASHQVRIVGNIFVHDPMTTVSAQLTTSGSPIIGDCNRVETATDGDLGGQPRTTTAPAVFINEPAGDYRLVDGSGLADYCDNSVLGSGANYTARGAVRPYDVSSLDLFGDYDLGGIESQPEDLIFANGF